MIPSKMQSGLKTFSKDLPCMINLLIFNPFPGSIL